MESVDSRAMYTATDKKFTESFVVVHGRIVRRRTYFFRPAV